MSQYINADRSQVAIMHGAQLPWVPSPEHGVERHMLERIGDEVALATSIVRYQPRSRFSSHTHDLGEEFLVLEGKFSDEHGAYPVGTYVRNPPGSSHAPFSEEGCTILVKLRQMAPNNRDEIKLFPDQQVWQSLGAGIDRALLYVNGSMSVELLRVSAGQELPIRQQRCGVETFVVQGALTLSAESQTILNRWSWLRSPDDVHYAMIAQHDSLLWIKRGHLNPLEDNG